MKKTAVIMLFACSIAACKKEVSKTNGTEKSLTTFHIRNLSGLELNYPAGCESNIIFRGVPISVLSGNDTVCTIKVDSLDILSLKTHPGHVVSLGGCTARSITIHH